MSDDAEPEKEVGPSVPAGASGMPRPSGSGPSYGTDDTGVLRAAEATASAKVCARRARSGAA